MRLHLGSELSIDGAREQPRQVATQDLAVQRMREPHVGASALFGDRDPAAALEIDE